MPLRGGIHSFGCKTRRSRHHPGCRLRIHSGRHPWHALPKNRHPCGSRIAPTQTGWSAHEAIAWRTNRMPLQCRMPRRTIRDAIAFVLPGSSLRPRSVGRQCVRIAGLRARVACCSGLACSPKSNCFVPRRQQPARGSPLCFDRCAVLAGAQWNSAKEGRASPA